MIDFHAHLDLYPDPLSVVREISARGMYVLSVTTTPSAWKGTSALVQAGSRIRTALGLHPQLAHLRFGELELFDEYLPQVMYVGEIGLDGGPEYKQHWPAQLAVFDHILGPARPQAEEFCLYTAAAPLRRCLIVWKLFKALARRSCTGSLVAHVSLSAQSRWAAGSASVRLCWRPRRHEV